jgi:hypothetical protein
MGRWHRARRQYENAQTFENEPTRAQVIGPAPIDPDVKKQLEHANQQIELTRQYPGRSTKGP